MKMVLILAGKEIQEGLRNRWVLATTLLMASLALALTFLGSAPTGSVGVRALDVVIVEPVQPHHLPRAADRPPDRARCHRG